MGFRVQRISQGRERYGLDCAFWAVGNDTRFAEHGFDFQMEFGDFGETRTFMIAYELCIYILSERGEGSECKID